DFHCCIQPFTGRNAYIKLKDKLFDALKQASAAHTIIATGQIFGDETFSLQNLFAEERHRIMKLLSQETLSRVDQLYTQVYRDNYGVLMAFHRDELPVPQELQVAAEIALSTRCLHYVKELKANYDDFPSFSSNMVELEAIATEANHLHCHLNIVKAKPTLEKLILRSLSSLLESGNPDTLTSDIHKVDRLINLGNQLHLGLSLDKCQEFYFNCLHSQILPQWQSLMKKPDNFPDKDPGNGHHSSPKITKNLGEIKQLLQLGQKLAVAVTPWVKGF
ncbi:MAG TPA: glycoside hydrolase, partial [Cyanobacteria bacterium UBA11367]|nr:glycoside hydrolase [Cyanobacteria bacterium UBA11367]